MVDAFVDISDGPPRPPPPPPSDRDPPRHAGWDGAITVPLPSPRKFPARPTTGKLARAAGVAVSPHAGHPAAVSSAGKKGAYAGHVGFDWKALSAKLPTGRDPASTAERKAMFNKFDINANGLLSVAEVDKAVRDVLKSPAMFKSKPAVMRAFQAAKRANGKGRGPSGDFVERNEFRLLLSYLRSYFQLYAAFSRVDTSDDRRIDLGEWRKGVGLLKRWGIDLSPSQVCDLPRTSRLHGLPWPSLTLGHRPLPLPGRRRVSSRRR